MNYSHLAYFVVSALILYTSFLIIISDIAPIVYETIHRQSIWHTISFTYLLGTETKIELSTLVPIQVFLSILLFSKDKKERRSIIFLSMVLFISLAMYLILGKAELLLCSSLLLSYFTLKNRIGIAIYVNLLLLLMSIFESSSLIVWLIYPLVPVGFPSSLLLFSYLEKEIFYSLNALLGYPLFVILLFSWPFAVLMCYIFRVQQVRVERYKVRIILGKSNKVVGQSFSRAIELTKSTLFDARFAFPVSLIALLYLSFYSYIPTMNPTGKFTNVDGIGYYISLNEFESVLKGTLDYGAFKNGYGGQRLTSTLLAFLIRNLLNVSPMSAVKLSYFVASVFLVVSTYMSLKLTFKDNTLALLSIYLTTFSTQVVVGLYAGSLAIWLACSLLILMSALAVSGVEERKLNRLVLSVALSIIGIFTHPWSWFVYVTTIALLFICLLFSDKSARKMSTLVLLLTFSFFVLSFIMDYIKQDILGILSGIQSDIPLIRSMSLVNLFLFPRYANFTLQIMVGGFLNNYLIFILSIVGVVFMLKAKGKMPWFLLTLGIVMSLPVFFLHYDFQRYLLYLMPLNIYSTFGCDEILKFAKKKGVNESLLLTLILLLLANYSFRSVANLI